MRLPRVGPWEWGVWVLAFFIMEGVAVFNGVTSDTLTQTTLHTVPGFAIIAGLGWLCVHFGRRVLYNWRTHRKNEGL